MVDSPAAERSRGVAASLGRYAAHDEPLAAAANVVALLIAANQPFYVLTLWWVGGVPIDVAILNMLATPLFLAVPALARRSSLAGRVGLTVVGTANTLLGAKFFGQASGVELFLGPCLLAAGLLFRQSEQRLSFGLIAAIFAALFAAHDRYGAPLFAGSDADYEALVRVDAVSAAALTAFMAVIAGRARDADARRDAPTPPT